MIKKLIVSILIVLPLAIYGQQKESKEILFVCTHGAARSPIAAAYFNKLAKENNLNYHAVFRGTEPDEALTPETINGLTEDGFNVNDWMPKKVSNQDIGKAYKIVTFDCSVSSKKYSATEEQWNGTPSISEDYNKARNVIKGNVEQLIERLIEPKTDK